MRTIIAGSRSCDYKQVSAAADSSPWPITEVVSGTAKGADQFGELWAAFRNLPVKRFPADWSKGKSAGHQRNAEMARYAEALIAVWDGESKGTRGMINEAKRRGLRILVVYATGRP